MSDEYQSAAAPPVPCDAMLGTVLDRMADEKERPVEATPTPWPSWNTACRSAGGGIGIARGWHVVIGARSGAGKSLVGCALAAHAIQHGERVGLLSLEMTQIEIQTRIMAIVARANIRTLEHGTTFDRSEWERASRELQRIYQEQQGLIIINREIPPNLRGIADTVEHLVTHREVRYLIVDYLQLAAIGGGRASEILDRVTEVSHFVRGVAKRHRVTTIGLSQLNRETSKSTEQPRKEGLMGGSPLENDADQVLLLDHSRVSRDVHTGAVLSYAILDKNRHGPPVEIPTYLSTTTLAITERLPDEVEEKPRRLEAV